MRKRLTSKQLFAENRKDGLFPGDIGNEEREKVYYDVDEFDNEASEFKPGWDLPEKNTIDDKRDEMNFGIKKEFKAYNMARRAVLMAQAFLGQNATEDQVEFQASQFLKLGDAGIKASLKLWKATEECAEEIEAPAVEPAKVETADENPEDVKETPAEVPAETPADEKVKVDETDADDTADKIDDVSELEAVDKTEAPVEEVVEETVEAVPAETEMELDVEADPTLEAAFADEEVEIPEEKPVASVTAKKKEGISHMAQPKLTTAAVKNEANELDMVWTDLSVPTHL